MGRILVHEFSTLDGVVETPSWTMEFGFDPRMGESIGALMGSCRGLLLGRTTYEMFHPAWASRSAEEDPGAPFMNDSPKYVVSSTLTDPEWNNSEAIGAYDPEVIGALKARADGDLYVSGSVTLVRALLADGLIDELHLFVYPVLLGGGLRLFGESEQKRSFTLSASERYDNGVVHLAYAPAA